MQSNEGAKATPQFETAEFQTQPGKDACFVCHQPISGTYYRVNTRMACSACTERLQSSVPKDNHGAFMRALAFGAGGAIVGLVLYSTVTIVTGLAIGYVSLAVGWIVGKAMMKGSGGLGGRRYQIAALIFTYAAVSFAAIPLFFSEIRKEKTTGAEPQVQSQPATSQADRPIPENVDSQPQSRTREKSADAQPPHLAAAVGMLALIGLASPFLELGSDPFHGMIGLVILLVGIRIAWQIARGRPPLVVDGPF
jgi:hypothetical protein